MRNAIVALLVAVAVPFVFKAFIAKKYRVAAPGSGVFITGCSSGIGRHAAVTLAEEGFVVYGTVRKEADATALGAAHENIVPVLMDVTDQAAVSAAVANLLADLDKRGIALAALVNNAGVSYNELVEAMDVERARWVFEVNYFSVIRLTQELLPALRRDQGRVVITSSLAGHVSRPFNAAYAGSKHAIEALADALRMELDEAGVAVSVVKPGYVQAAMLQRSAQDAGGAGKNLSPEQQAAYSAVIANRNKRTNVNDIADSPAVTSEAILHAVTAEYPQTRYPVAGVGVFPAWVVLLIKRILPDFAMDWMILRN